MLIKLGRGMSPLINNLLGGGGGGGGNSLAGIAGIQMDIDTIESPYVDPRVTSLINPDTYIFNKTIGVTDLDKEVGGTYWDVDAETDGIAWDSVASGGTEPQFLLDFHKGIDGDVWVGVAFRSPAVWAGTTGSNAENMLIGNQNDNPVTHGWNLMYNKADGKLGIQIMDGSTVETAVVTQTLQTSTDYLIFAHLSHSSGTTSVDFYVSSIVPSGVNPSTIAVTTTTDATGLTMLGNDDSQTRTSPGIRYYWWGMGDAALTTADLRSIADVLETRHGRTYFNAPKNITGLKLTYTHTNWVGWVETKIFDASEAEVSQTLSPTAGSKGVTAWSGVADGEFATDSTYSSSVAAMNDTVTSSQMWSTNNTSGMIGWFDFNATLDQLTKVQIIFSSGYGFPTAAFEDSLGNAIPIVFERAIAGPGGTITREYLF